MACEIHLNDVGTEFRITIKDCNSSAIDLSSATTKSIFLKKPSGITVEKTALFYTDGTDGILKYVTIADDLSEVGSWKIQAQVTAPNGIWKSEFKTFKVLRNL